VLWSDVREGWAAKQRHLHTHPALQEAIDEVFDTRIGDVSGRGKLGADMREIWMMQPRFDKRVGSAPFGLVEQPRFRAGFDFMRLRADIGEVDVLLADWWQEFSTGDDNLRQDLVDQVRAEQSSKPRPKRTHTLPKAVPDNLSDDEVLETGETGHTGAVGAVGAEGDAPKKRRRRRRSGARQDAPPAAE
jgi:poly(A) polymerase